MTISKKLSNTLLALLKKGRGFSTVELTNFNDKKVKLSILLRGELKIKEGEAIFENIEEVEIINQKERRKLTVRSETPEQSEKKKETINIVVPEVVKFDDSQIETKDMLINTNSVCVSPTINGINEFSITNAYKNIGDIHFDKSLREFTFDVDFAVPAAQIVEKRLWFGFVREKVVESEAELILDISYNISKKIEPIHTVKSTLTNEGELSFAYDSKKYALKQIKLVDERGGITYFEKTGDYGRIIIKNEPGKINIQFK
jgi:hypothetical protein